LFTDALRGSMFAAHNGFNVGKGRERERERERERGGRGEVETRSMRACVALAQRMISFRGDQEAESVQSIHPSTVYRARFRFRLVSPSDKGSEVGPALNELQRATTSRARVAGNWTASGELEGHSASSRVLCASENIWEFRGRTRPLPPPRRRRRRRDPCPFVHSGRLSRGGGCPCLPEMRPIERKGPRDNANNH
jgi:hypothetical protein